MAMISAHRCGAGREVELENTRTALLRAIATDVEYVEFDVRRCADGTFVLFHDASVLVHGSKRPVSSMAYEDFAARADHYLRYDEVLETLAASGKKAHVDLKLVSPPADYATPDRTAEVEVTRQAVAAMGAANIVVTTNEDRSVAAVRAWADDAGVDLLVGLSLGRGRRGLTLLQAARQVLSEIFPGRRYRACGANLVVVQRHLARLAAARWARRHGLPLLVWTVDSERELAYWLQPGRAWLVTTNEPLAALRVREQGRA